MATNGMPIQRGAVTHHQLQSITWQSFKTRNTKKRAPPKLMPFTETFLLSDISCLFFNSLYN